MTIEEYIIACRSCNPSTDPTTAALLISEAAKIAERQIKAIEWKAKAVEQIKELNAQINADKITIDLFNARDTQKYNEVLRRLDGLQQQIASITEQFGTPPPAQKRSAKKATPEPSQSETAKKYGEYKRVTLTDNQYNRLIEDFGESVTTQGITEVDEYCEQTGKKYKNYYLTVRNFIRRDGSGHDGKQAAQKSADKSHSYDLNKLLQHAIDCVPEITEED
ncbi:MAG: hypothetical protein LUI05_02205 [Oscillospiraceae bacterium]|nr:hypothetical protein [Oscillospiraceae bacterium]